MPAQMVLKVYVVVRLKDGVKAADKPPVVLAVKLNRDSADRLAAQYPDAYVVKVQADKV